MYSLLAFAIFCVVQNGNFVKAMPGIEPRTLPCPVDTDIAPCLCIYDADDHVMNLDCSAVTGSADLGRVFQAYFPFPAFHKLSVLDNIHVKDLTDGILGNVTFESVEIYNCAVRSVGANVFSNSVATLTSLVLFSNHIPSFPFESFTTFKVLETLDLRKNMITTIPPLVMSKLKDLDLSENPISALPENVFSGIPAITHIYLDKTNIQELAKKIFGTNRQLNDISFGGSQIRHLVKDSLRISGSPDLHFIELHNNQINIIDVGAVVGTYNVEILLMNNLIESLPKAVFNPILAGNNTLRLEGNSLGCGCDVAWLVTDSSLHHLVKDAQCYDGEFLTNLDPTFYEDFCP